MSVNMKPSERVNSENAVELTVLGILEVRCRGEKNAMHVREIAIHTFMVEEPDDNQLRAVRKACEVLRNSGEHFVISSNSGIFIAQTAHEIEDYIATMEKKKAGITKSIYCANILKSKLQKQEDHETLFGVQAEPRKERYYD